MAKVLFVSYDVQTVNGRGGGVGAFLTHFGLLLREAGDEVTILHTNAEFEPRRVDEKWRAFYREHGISLMEVTIGPPYHGRKPDFWGLRMSEAIEPLIGAFDIVYFGDWGNPALQVARKKRLSAEGRGPVLVTVLHGPNEWVLLGDRRYPVAGNLHLEYMERYGAECSDWVVSPSSFMAEHLRRSGWRFPNVAVLGLPFFRPRLDGDVAPARIDRIVYFGRLERKKGFDLFVEALRIAAACDPALMEQCEVVLLGGIDVHTPGASEKVLSELTAMGFRARHISNFDSQQANEFLARDAHRTLCVVPSRGDNFPYALIETSLIRGLNVITCRVGGIVEMFAGPFERQLAEVSAESIAAAIADRIRAPIPAEELFRYDVDAANQRWLAFHRQALGQRGAKPVVSSRTVDVFVYGGKANAELSAQIGKPAVSLTAGSGELILVVDAQVVLTNNAIARLTEAIGASGADCIVCGGREGAALHLPVGADLTAALIDPDTLGRNVLVARRSALDGLGDLGQRPDWEIQVRLILAGRLVDVVPEYLYSREQSSRAEEFRLMVELCDKAAAVHGLPGFASRLVAQERSRAESEARAATLERQIQFAERRMGLLDGMFLHGTRVDDPSPWPVRMARRLYRSWLPLERRLAIEERFLSRLRKP